jgi:hypothetical protein
MGDKTVNQNNKVYNNRLGQMCLLIIEVYVLIRNGGSIIISCISILEIIGYISLGDP